MWKKVFDWLDERLGLNDIYKNLLDRPEPKGNWWNTLGSASLFLFVLQGATGIFLTVYYTPSPDHAYDSIQYIMEGVAFGWLIRGIHHWGASLMVIVVFIHMLRVFVTASYKYPREMTWLIGIGLLLTTIGMGFTGYLAPLESTGLLGNNGRHTDRGQRSLHRRLHPQSPARRTGPERAHVAALLCRAYLDDPRRAGWLDRRASVSHHQTRRVPFPDERRLTTNCLQRHPETQRNTKSETSYLRV